MSKRNKKSNRSELIPYYIDLLERIKEVIQCHGSEREVVDSAIEKMLEDLQNEATGLENIGCYTKLDWLKILLKKVERQLKIAQEREDDLHELENTLHDHDKGDTHFLEGLKSTKLPSSSEAWYDMGGEPIPDRNIALLKRNYPESVVQMFLRLLQSEKMRFVNQERADYENFVSQLRKDLLTEVRRGLETSRESHKEYRRIAKVLKDVELEKLGLLNEVEKEEQSSSSEFQEKNSQLNVELDAAKKRLQDAQEQSEALEYKLSKQYEDVNQLVAVFNRREEDRKKDSEMLSKELTELQNKVSKQERKLMFLKQNIEEKNLLRGFY